MWGRKVLEKSEGEKHGRKVRKERIGVSLNIRDTQLRKRVPFGGRDSVPERAQPFEYYINILKNR